MAAHVRSWIGWWICCAALWLLLVDRTPTDELLVGAGVAAGAATAAVLVGRPRLTPSDPRSALRWLGAAVRPLAGVVGDLVPLTRVLVTRGLLRRPAPPRLTEVPYARVGDDRDDQAHRALTEALGSLAPNTIVVRIDRERRVLLAHQLEPTEDVARRARPLPGSAP